MFPAIFETNIRKTLTTIKIKKEKSFCGVSHERDFFEVDGVRVTFKIPFDREPKLFEVKQGTRITTSFLHGVL